jgi:hypothetical protein
VTIINSPKNVVALAQLFHQQLLGLHDLLFHLEEKEQRMREKEGRKEQRQSERQREGEKT